jgi:hypothetical protein
MDNFTVDFIGIGSARSGTTWLAHVLSEHPDICVSKPKELDYFSKRTLFLPTSNCDMPLSWYESKFAHCKKNQLRGEWSPSYLVDPDAPRLIHEQFPDVKILIALRNPVEALVSHYQNIRVFHPMEWPFEEFLEHRPDFLQHYNYAAHVERYLRTFDTAHVFLYLYDDVCQDPHYLIRRILHFLGVDENLLSKAIGRRINSASSTRLPLLRDALSTTKGMLDRNKLVRKIYKTAHLDAVGWNLVRWNSRPSRKVSIAPETVEKIAAYYEEPIRQLEKMIQRDLSTWKQPALTRKNAVR